MGSLRVFKKTPSFTESIMILLCLCIRSSSGS